MLITSDDYEDNERIDSDKDDAVQKWSSLTKTIISSILYFFMLSSLMMAADDDDFV